MINLYYNNAYKWYHDENIYVIGYVFYKNELYDGNKLIELVKKSDIEKEVKYFSGSFAIVIKKNEEIILLSDIVRSFPVFYTSSGVVVDNINLLKNKINFKSLNELKQARLVSGSKTIYDGVFQLEASQIVRIKKGKISTKKYFEYKLSEKKHTYKELDQIFLNVFKRLIKYLNGRQVVVPLSGGHDSRLLVYYLKKLNYSNIVTYTYGNKNGKEVNISKKVAEYLELPWYFVEYDKKGCNKVYYSQKNEILNYYGRGYAVPLIQDLKAIDELLKKKIIDKNSVICPGFTLDFLAGNHVPFEFTTNEMVNKTLIKKKIYQNNYNLTKKDNSFFDKILEKSLKTKFSNIKISSLNAEEIFDSFDIFERQAKFVNNGVRNYDYYGLKWYLPFWDLELVNFFQELPLKEKYMRKFFKEFTEYEYKELMEYAPIYVEDKNVFNGKFKLLRKINYIFYIYNNHYLNFYHYFKFRVYLKFVILNKNFNYDYYIAKDYEKYLKGVKK